MQHFALLQPMEEVTSSTCLRGVVRLFVGEGKGEGANTLVSPNSA